METIKLTCETCNTTHDLKRKMDDPPYVMFMKCNWCPLCEDRAQDYYDEWVDEDDDRNFPDRPKPIPVPDNQLVMPFIFDELEIPKPTPCLLT